LASTGSLKLISLFLSLASFFFLFASSLNFYNLKAAVS
jgi:hypothetical protein